MVALGECNGLIVRRAPRFGVIKETIAASESLPDVSIGEKAPVLGMPCEFDGFLGAILGQAGVCAGFPGVVCES